MSKKSKNKKEYILEETLEKIFGHKVLKETFGENLKL